MIISKQGITIRTQASQIRVTGRIAQGVNLIDLAPKDYVVDVARIVPDDKSVTGEPDADDASVEEEITDAVE
jgi:hypothetical protein